MNDEKMDATYYNAAFPMGKNKIVGISVKQKRTNTTEKKGELFKWSQATMRDPEAFEEGLGSPGVA